jgi:predicted RNA-binding protein YlxR (DUF448 family)
VDAKLVIDGSVRGPGRGAYLCPRTVCVERALARDASALRRALHGSRARPERPERLEVAALEALQARLATQEPSPATDGAQTP